MTGEKLGGSQSKTKKESQDHHQSLKRSESQISLAELMHSITKPKISKKKKNDELQTSMGSNQKSPSTVIRNNEVILALSCPKFTEKKVTSRKKVVSNEEVPVKKNLVASKALDEPEQVCTVQPKKKRKKEGKNEEVQKKDETLSGGTETPVQSFKTYKRKGKKSPLDNNLDEKRDNGLDEGTKRGVLKKKRSKREAHTDNPSKNILRHNFSDDCLPHWNDGDSSKVQKTVHEQSRGDSLIDGKGNGSLSLLEMNGLSRDSSSHGVKVMSGHGSATPNDKISSIDESSAIHSNALEKKKKIKRKSKTENSSDLATVQELCKEGHNTSSRNCRSVSVDEPPVNLADKISEPKKKLRKEKKKDTSHVGKTSDDMSTLDSSADQSNCALSEGIVAKSSKEYHEEEVVPSVSDAVKVVPEIKKNSPYPQSSKAKSKQDTASELCEAGHNSLSRDCAILSVDESPENLPDKKSESRKKLRKDKRKRTSQDAKDSADLLNVECSVEQPEISFVEGTVTKSLHEYPAVGEGKHDAVMLDTEIKENTSYSHTSKEKSQQDTSSELRGGHNASSNSHKLFSTDESSVNLLDKRSESRKRPRKDKMKHTYDLKHSHDLSNADHSAEQPVISLAEGSVTKSLTECHEGEVVPSIGEVKNDAVMLGTELMENTPYPHTSQEKSGQDTVSELCEEGLNTLSMNCTTFSVDESPVILPDKISESRKRLKKGKRKHTSHDAKGSEGLPNVDCSAEQPGFPFAEGTVTKSLNKDHKEEVAPSMNCTTFSVDGSPVNLPDKISESRKRLRKDKRKHTSHNAKDSEDLSNLDCSAEQSGFPLAEGTVTKSLNEDHKEEVVPSVNCTTFSVDASPVNLADKMSESRKRPRKDKGKHTSHDAKDSEDLSNLDCSAEQRGVPFVEGTVTKSLKEDHKEEVVPSIGDIKDDAVIVGTEIKQNTLVERPASPGRALVDNMPKKLLVLDLNGLLVDIVSSLPEGYKADKRIARKALLKRPFCDDFIRFCFERFNVGVWSSRTKQNVDSVVDFIMGDMRHRLLFCWHQSHCTKTGFSTVEDECKPMVFKELKKLWEKWEPKLPWVRGEYNESNTLLLDDSPYKALLNPRHTAIFPHSYDFRNADDNSLGPSGDLRVYLEKISAAEHVQKYVEQNPFGQRAVTSKNPSWVYYLMVINANRLCLPT